MSSATAAACRSKIVRPRFPSAWFTSSQSDESRDAARFVTTLLSVPGIPLGRACKQVARLRQNVARERLGRAGDGEAAELAGRDRGDARQSARHDALAEVADPATAPRDDRAVPPQCERMATAGCDRNDIHEPGRDVALAEVDDASAAPRGDGSVVLQREAEAGARGNRRDAAETGRDVALPEVRRSRAAPGDDAAVTPQGEALRRSGGDRGHVGQAVRHAALPHVPGRGAAPAHDRAVAGQGEAVRPPGGDRGDAGEARPGRCTDRGRPPRLPRNPRPPPSRRASAQGCERSRRRRPSLRRDRAAHRTGGSWR